MSSALARTGNPASLGWAAASQPAVWAEIYEPEVYLAAWQRSLDASVYRAAEQVVAQSPGFGLLRSGRPGALREELLARLPASKDMALLVADIGQLLDMMMELFAPPALGLRLEVAERANCPRFHVDRLGVRLVCTYWGPATEWLEHDAVDRTWLGPRSVDVSDEDCGLIRPGHAIRQAQTGDALLLKGEGWDGNDGRGVVHRSPPLQGGERRLVLSVDPAGA